MSANLTLSRSPANSTPRPGLFRSLAGVYKRTIGGVEQYVHNPISGAPAKMEQLLRHLVNFGAVGLARRIVKRFTDVVEQRTPEPLSNPLMLDAQAADMAEDGAELAYALTPNADTLEKLIRAKEKAALADLAVADSLRAVQRASER